MFLIINLLIFGIRFLVVNLFLIAQQIAHDPILPSPLNPHFFVPLSTVKASAVSITLQRAACIHGWIFPQMLMCGWLEQQGYWGNFYGIAVFCNNHQKLFKFDNFAHILTLFVNIVSKLDKNAQHLGIKTNNKSIFCKNVHLHYCTPMSHVCSISVAILAFTQLFRTEIICDLHAEMLRVCNPSLQWLLNELLFNPSQGDVCTTNMESWRNLMLIRFRKWVKFVAGSL